jgi:hypothetical protein
MKKHIEKNEPRRERQGKRGMRRAKKIGGLTEIQSPGKGK